MTDAAATSLADERYVSLATFRKTGKAVASPVWIVPIGVGRFGLTTAPDAGKVKRLRNNPAVELTPCDVRGNVRAGAATTSGAAHVVTSGPDFDAVIAGLVRKYGIQARMLNLGTSLRRLVGRPLQRTVVVIDITPADAAA